MTTDQNPSLHSRVPVLQASLGATPCQSLHKLLFQGVPALQASLVLTLATLGGPPGFS